MPNRRIEDYLQRVLTLPDRICDDVHIDEISNQYEDPSKWIDGSLTCMQEAIRIRDITELPLTITVGFSLLSHTSPVGFTASTVKDLENEFDGTPPSIYAFPYGKEPWTNNTRYKEVSIAPQMRPPSVLHSYFIEQFDENDREYRRKLWISE